VAGAKTRIAAIGWCVVGVVLLGAVFAVSECDRRVARYLHRKFLLKPRRAEDAVTPVAKDVQRHAGFLERAKQGDIEVVFLGDSITDRWPRVGEGSWLRLAPYKPANFGIEGDCTEHLLWRVEHGELEAISPKVVVVLIGSNNVFYFPDEAPGWTAKGIEKIVGTIQERSPAARVLLFGIFPRDEKGSRLRQTIGAINREIKRLDDGTRVRFVDIGDQFLDADGNIPAAIMPDKVHLSAKGYAIWQSSLESILPEMMK